MLQVPNSAILESKVDWDVDSKAFITLEQIDGYLKHFGRPSPSSVQ